MPGTPEAARSLFLNPCVLFAHRQEHVVTTVLGSCVAVCLWDPAQAFGGINHFMLPLWNGEGLPTPKYGNVAIEKLVERMLKLGSSHERLVAKVFGGANVLGFGNGYFNVGSRNAELCETMLGRLGITIAASDLRGEWGRKIVFNTRTGRVQIARWAQASGSSAQLPDGRPQKKPAPLLNLE